MQYSGFRLGNGGREKLSMKGGGRVGWAVGVWSSGAGWCGAERGVNWASERGCIGRWDGRNLGQSKVWLPPSVKQTGHHSEALP